MNAALISLELRKNRLTLVGLAASCAMFPPLSLLVSSWRGLDAAVTLQAGMWWWVIVGLPLSAAILGAGAGASLRRPEAREAESPLPQSPAGRVLRGFAGALLQFLILVLVAALIGAIFSRGWSRAVFDGPADPKGWSGPLLYRGLVSFFALELIASSFLASYALGHAFAGGLIGSVLALSEAFAILVCLQYSAFFPERVESFMPIAYLALIAGIAAKGLAVKPLAARFERSRPLGAAGAAGAVLLVLAGLLASWGAQESAYARLRSSLRLLKPGVSSFLLTLGPSTDDAEGALYPAVRGAGALATSAAGGLVWIAPDGRTVRLLPDGAAGRFELLTPWGARVDSAVWDESGRLLASRRIQAASGDRTEFWAGRPDKGLRPVDPALGTPEQIVREDGAAGIRFMKDGQQSFCRLDDDGRARSCAPSKTGWTYHRSYEPQPYPLAARVSKDGRTLLRPGPRPRTWRLPGTASDAYDVAAPILAYLVGGKPAYFVPIRIKDDEAIAVCLDDGRVLTAWRHGFSGVRAIGGLQLEVLPDGTLVYQYAYDWSVVDPAGTFLPPIVSKRLFERWPRPAGAPAFTPRLVHRAGGRAWIVFEGARLVEMDESTGMPVKDWPLPVKAWKIGSYDGTRILEGGLLVQEFGAPFFVAWDGTARALRAP